MATYTDEIGFDRGSAGFHEKGLHRIAKLEVTLDIDAIVAARLAAGATALAAGDILEALPIAAGTYVIAAGLNVTTATAATCTVDLGDGSDVDGYVDGYDPDTVGYVAPTFALTEAAPNTIIGYGAGKLYAAADTIDLVLLTAIPTGAVIKVWAIAANLRP